MGWTEVVLVLVSFCYCSEIPEARELSKKRGLLWHMVMEVQDKGSCLGNPKVAQGILCSVCSFSSSNLLKSHCSSIWDLHPGSLSHPNYLAKAPLWSLSNSQWGLNLSMTFKKKPFSNHSSPAGGKMTKVCCPGEELKKTSHYILMKDSVLCPCCPFI